MTVCWCNSRCTRCKIVRRTRMVKVRSLESMLFWDIFVFVMYYVYVTSGPSLLTESTDSMIIAHVWTTPYMELPSNGRKWELRSLSSATAVNKQQWELCKLSVIATYSLLTTKRTQVLYATSLLIRFWLQCCYSYTEKLYTSKSCHLTYHYSYSRLIIYHDCTCELIRMIIMQFWS